MYNKIFASVAITTLSIGSVAGVSDEQLFNESRTRVQQLQLTDPTLPSGVDSKGLVGEILSRMFNASGSVRPIFIADLPATKITSGEFDAARIPNLDTSKITTGNFNFSRISNVSISTTMVADNAITSPKIASNAITNVKVASNAAIAGTKISPNFGSQNIVTTGNTGLGNTTPNFRLDVNGDINFSGQLRQGGTPVNFAGKWQDGSSGGQIYYNAGNVGIGTDSPSQRLDIAGNIKTSGTIDFTGAGNAIIQLSGTDIVNFNQGGPDSVGIGVNAGLDSTGDNRNAIGNSAGAYSTSVSQNAFGKWAGRSNTGNNQNALGALAGFNNTGIHQNALGNNAGDGNIGNNQNVLGNQSGRNNTGENQNALGDGAGYNNTGNNQNALGWWAGRNNTRNNQNVFGGYAGVGNTGENQNAMGDAAGADNTGENQNAIGKWAGRNNSGDSQIVIGVLAGFNNTGDYVVGIGHDATGGNTANNVIGIGHRAGYNNTLANQFIVRQSNVNGTPLIQGDFASGNVGIGTTSPSQKLDVAGNVRATAFLYSSDKNLKTNITPYTNGKNVIAGIKVSSYNWKDSAKADVGVIAQDVQKVFPEAVSVGADGTLSVDYAKLVVPLIQVVQEQEARLIELEDIIQTLR